MQTEHLAPPAPVKNLSREAFWLSALCTIVLFGLSLILITWRVEQLLTDLSQQRVLRLTQQISQEAERAMRFGISLQEQSALLSRLQQLDQEEPQLFASMLKAADGTVITQSADPQLPSSILASWQRQQRSSTDPGQAFSKSEGSKTYIARALTDASGKTNAVLWAAIDTQLTQRQAHASALRILSQIAPLLALTLALSWWALWRLGLQWQAPANIQRHPAILALIAILLCTATPLAMVWTARETARPLVAEQIAANADQMGRTLSQQITRALDYGIPLAQLQGMQELFRNALQQAPELSYLALQSSPGKNAYTTQQAGTYSPSALPPEQQILRSTPLPQSGAAVVVGYPSNYVDNQLAGMLLDLLLALLVSAVLMLECARGRFQRSTLAALAAEKLAWRWAALRSKLLGRSPTAPKLTALSPATTEQMLRLRFIIFLVALSEELLRPFFTVFAIDMRPLGLQLSPTMVAGLPVAAFMATLALAQPLGPVLARRFDLRWGLIFSACAGCMALAATGLANSALTLVALRAFAGMAYGMALILAQTALVRITTAQQRARGMTQIASAIVAAGIVGPPFGGLIAAQAGAAIGFAACALCMLLAACVSLRLQLPAPTQAPAASATGGLRGYWAVVRNPRALAVIFCAALPARLVAVTVLVVVVPLQMSALQQPTAMTGRTLLLYFLVFASSVSLFASWSDDCGKRLPFLLAGGLVSALACWALPGLGGVLGMAACCALLGLGQALQSSPQLALVTEIFEQQPGKLQLATPEQALAAFRLLERLGSIAAPFVTAWATAAFGYSGAMIAIGVFLALATLAMLPGLRSTPPKPALSPNVS